MPRDPTLVFTFTEPVNVVGQWFDLTCATTGVHDSYSLAGNGPFVDVTLNVNLLAGEVCTITIFKDQVHDQDTDDCGAGHRHAPGELRLVVHGRQRHAAAVSVERPPDLRQSDECDHRSRALLRTT